MAKDTLKGLYNWFLQNLNDFRVKYKYGWLLIRNNEVVAHAATFDELYYIATKRFKLGDFLIQELYPTKENIY